MIATTLALAALAAFAPPPLRQEPDAAAIVGELIEHARALGPFRAEYHLEGLEAEDGRLVFEYLPDERLHMRLSSAGGSGGMESWLSGSRLSGLLTTDSGPSRWFEVDLEDPQIELPAWYEALEDRFPKQGAEGDYHVVCAIGWALNPDSGKVDLNVSAGFETGPGYARLGWLAQLRRDPSGLSVTDEAIVQEHERYRAVVSRETGFLEELVLHGLDGKTASLRLTALDLDPGLESGDLLAPARPEGAQDISAGATGSLLRGLFPEGPRLGVLRRIDGQLARGTIEWRTQTRDGAEEVLRALLEPGVETLASSYVPKLEGSLRGFFAELEQRRSGGETPEALEAEIEEWRGDLARTLEEGLPALRSRFTPAPERSGDSEHWDDLLGIEDEVLEALYVEHIRDPLLAAFDEAASAFRAGG